MSSWSPPNGVPTREVAHQEEHANARSKKGDELGDLLHLFLQRAGFRLHALGQLGDSAELLSRPRDVEDRLAATVRDRRAGQDRPRLAIDELAHTNLPGTRHESR